LKYSKLFLLASVALLAFASTTVATAQTTLGFRQTDLTCQAQCAAPNQSDFLLKPWGIAALPDLTFFIAENGAGRIDGYDITGVLSSSITIPLPGQSTATISKPTGIVVDPDLNLSVGRAAFELFAATEEGTIVGFTFENGAPNQVAIVVDHSFSAVFTGITLLHPSCCNPVLATANFHDGEIDVFGLSQIALPGPFEDPNLPAGYAPFNIQTIGNQVFVTYAKQDESRRAPVFGDGFGIVSIFDQEGNFIRRFASDGGKLNAPWGITMASANFGPFANDILIGNSGDGRIGVYDPATAEFLGPLTDGEQRLIANAGLRGMSFRNDGVGDPDSLFLVSNPEIDGVATGLFSSIGVGRLTTTRLTVQNAVVGSEAGFFGEVRPVAGDDTVPGKVVFFDDGVRIDDDGVVGGIAAIFPTFTRAGFHTITAEYLGADNFLPSIDHVQVTVLGPVTTTTMTAPISAGPGTPVIFRARTLAANAVPTGNITFQEGNNVLGVVPLDEHDTATFTTTVLGVGTHSVTAFYSGPDFQGSASAPVTVTVGGDFTVVSDTSSVVVTAGQSADFTLTVSPSGGFAGPVGFSCTPAAGVTCVFTPATLNVNQTPMSTKLTITTASTTQTAHGLGYPFVSFGLFGVVLVHRRARRAVNVIALITVLALALLLAACGGYGKQNSSGPPNPTPAASTVTLIVTGGSISHSTTIRVVVR
jgi:uncharacterized protein (TIGR03118 family)